MEIRNIMTSDPVSAAPDTTLEEIATIMKDEDIGAVPVVEDGELCGIVTDRDIVIRCIAAGKDPSECTAEDVMSGEIHSLPPTASLDEAARLMSDRQIRRLPIVEKKKVVGMVSLGDLAVKSHDDDLSGDTLEDVSKGVKQSSSTAKGSGGKTGKQRSAESQKQAQNLRSDSSPRKQGIANHSAKEENVRQDKVVPFRSENETRNTRVQKPSRGNRKSG